MGDITSTLSEVSKDMSIGMDKNKLTEVVVSMTALEKRIEDWDTSSGFVIDVMGTQAAQSTPASEVWELLQQVAEQNGLEQNLKLPHAGRNETELQQLKNASGVGLNAH